MTPEAQRIAIAEVCGWRNPNHLDTQALVANWWSEDRNVWWLHPDGKSLAMVSDVPDYLSDLNAMHEAWRAKIKGNCNLEDRFTVEVARACGLDHPNDSPNLSDYDIAVVSNATAAQRAEAFLRTLGKWVD